MRATLRRSGQSTFVWHNDAHLAELMFHELAHRRFYLKGDTAFNESYATAVASEGVCDWLGARGRYDVLARYQADSHLEDRFLWWVGRHREVLAAIYREPVNDVAKRRRKAAYLKAIQHDFENLLLSDPAFAPYRP